MVELERGMFGDDDEVGYYDYDEDNDRLIIAADGAFRPELLDNCCNRSG